MKKNTEIVSGLVNEEHTFHQVQTQPGKAKKHRYERRKVRNILKIADWGEAEEYERVEQRRRGAYQPLVSSSTLR